jgi:hypothetical protein
MFAPSDILVLLLLVGSVILILIARISSSDHRKDTSSGHDHETQPSAEQKETHNETNERTGHGQSKKKAAPCD